MPTTVLLGSRSPRRKELLGSVVPTDRLWVRPPTTDEEREFDGLTDRGEIENRLRAIAVGKAEAIERELAADERENLAGILTADTTILVTDPNRAGVHHALGKPPADNWRPIVRDWFTRYYAGRTHFALTALHWRGDHGTERTAVVSTELEFHREITDQLAWYLTTDEPIGKAGGYGVQGLASVFVREIRGSLTNVIGLPLETILVWDQELNGVFTRTN